MEESNEATAEVPTGEYDSDDSDVDDDDLHDIPDTREFMPLDVEGLQSLGIGGSLPAMKEGGYTMNDLRNMADNDVLDDLDEDEDDEDYLNDIRIGDGDALIVVAKTEDVSFCNLGHESCINLIVSLNLSFHRTSS